MNAAVAEVVIDEPDDRDEEEETVRPSEPEAQHDADSTAGQSEAWRWWLNGGEW